MHKEKKPGDNMSPVAGGIMGGLGLLILYLSLGIMGALTRQGLDFMDLFSWFAKSTDPTWEILGTIGCAIGLAVTLLSLVLIAMTKPLGPNE